MNTLPGKPLESRITTVTVYTDRAQVTRKGTVDLDGQETEIVLADLPITLNPESVRVQGRGTVAVRLLGVRTERQFATEPVAERVAQLSAEVEQLEEQWRSLTDQLTALNLQRTFVEKLGEQSVNRFAQSLARQQTGLTQTGELIGFVGQRYGELSAAIAQQTQQINELDKQIGALRQQLDQIQIPHAKESYCLRVAIAPTGTGQLDLEVSYGCYGASWTPLYDLRLNTTTRQLQLTYLAEIQQQTGEDWQDVALTLSTAKPGLGTLPPKLPPWYLDVVRPLVPAAVGMVTRQRSAIAEADYSDDDSHDRSLLLEATSIPQASPAPKIAQPAMTTIRREGSVVTFEAGGSNRVPSDGNSHKVTVFSDDYPVQLEYVAVPKLVSFAYLQAIVTNPRAGVTLLPGQANIFRDDRFVGTTPLDNISPGQEFRLNLGVDESFRIERDLTEREVDRKLIGGQRRITFGYRIRVENLQDSTSPSQEHPPLTLKLTEQLPISRNEQIKVRLLRSTPAIQPGEMGVLEWTLALPPQAKQEISYQFTIEYPPNLAVTGLES